MTMNNMDPRKIALLNEFKKLSAGKNNSEMLPLILAVTKKAQSLGISFTNEEIQSIASALMSEATPEQKNQMSMMLNLMNTQQNK